MRLYSNHVFFFRKFTPVNFSRFESVSVGWKFLQLTFFNSRRLQPTSDVWLGSTVVAFSHLKLTWNTFSHLQLVSFVFKRFQLVSGGRLSSLLNTAKIHEDQMDLWFSKEKDSILQHFFFSSNQGKRNSLQCFFETLIIENAWKFLRHLYQQNPRVDFSVDLINSKNTVFLLFIHLI